MASPPQQSVVPLVCRPPALAWVADQPNEDGIFLLPCPRSTWRISEVQSASFGAKEPHACNASMAYAAVSGYAGPCCIRKIQGSWPYDGWDWVNANVCPTLCDNTDAGTMSANMALD